MQREIEKIGIVYFRQEVTEKRHKEGVQKKKINDAEKGVQEFLFTLPQYKNNSTFNEVVSEITTAKRNTFFVHNAQLLWGTHCYKMSMRPGASQD